MPRLEARPIFGISPSSRRAAAARRRLCWGWVDRSSQLVSDEIFERKIKINVRNSVNRRHINDRRLEHRNIEKRLAPSLGPRRAGRERAKQKFRLGFPAERPAAPPPPPVP